MFEIIPILACEPTTIAMMVIAAASSAVQYMGAKQQAEATLEHQKAVGADMQRQEGLQQTMLASNVRDKLDASARQREAFQIKATTVASKRAASANESGATGASLEMAAQEFDAYDARWMEAQYLREDTALAKWDRDKALLASQVRGRLISNYSPIAQPSELAYGLEAAGGMLSAYDSYKTRQGFKPKDKVFEASPDISGEMDI